MDYRHELKFVVTDIEIEKLRARLDTLMEIDPHQHGDSYRIRSLYFDDYYDTCLNENLSGVDDRFKYRLRFYGDNLQHINLEKKYKYHGMTRKLSERVAEEKARAYAMSEVEASGRELADELYISHLKSGMSPKCIVEYDRCAYVEPVGNVRVTFDMNLRGSMGAESFLNTEYEFTYPVMPSGFHVLEVKFDEFLPKHILQVIDINSLRRQSFSKYALVREAAV